jgi:hypothetical protein
MQNYVKKPISPENKYDTIDEVKNLRQRRCDAMIEQAMRTYYVRNAGEQDPPIQIQAKTRRAALNLFAGSKPLPKRQFEMWTAIEWKNQYPPCIFYTSDL